jgi:hypothetical protein
MDTKFNNKQFLDLDFALQGELDSVEDNNTGLFDPSTMNNKNLYDLIKLLQDNNTTGFDSSTMNNKNLYDLIQQLLTYGSNKDSSTLATQFSTTSTSANLFLTHNTQIWNPGIYIIKFDIKSGFINGDDDTYINLFIQFDSDPIEQISKHWVGEKYLDDEKFRKSNFIFKTITSNLNHTVKFYISTSDSSKPAYVWDFYIETYKVSL